MRRYVFRLAVAACTMLGPAIAVAGVDEDKSIATTIVEKLQDEKRSGNLKGFAIDLQVEDGTVWLSGNVANSDQQAKALDIARRVRGVKQVVNDLEVGAPGETSSVQNATGGKDESAAVAASATEYYAPESRPVMPASGEIGSGVAARPVSAQVQNAGAPRAMPQQAYPAHANQMPRAYSQARGVSYQAEYCPPGGPGGPGGGPTPMYAPGSGAGGPAARYDHPQMPGYAWPTYAATPNYAAVTYPKQYSPTAWPYIGPFYPYPQVPLGWRKVTLEWDDGWWMLDFKDRRGWSRK